ncbi:MAG: DUF4147 domain-containing protein [Polyangiaceae bacterium]
MSETVRALAETVRGAFLGALDGFALRAIVAQALPPLPPKRARVIVVAVGKAAIPMMRGALDRWPDRIERGLAVTVPQAAEHALPANVEVLTCPHPIPDDRSVAAAERALAIVRGLDLPDLVLALVSGGASSLVAAPPEGVSLDDKRAAVRDLLESGATIRDVNLVRRHASRIKGGGLLAAAAPARVLTLAVSDVIGGGLHDIGSGPSVPDPTTLEDARAALRRFAPAWESRLALRESVKPEGAPRWRAQVIAGPTIFGERVRDRLLAEGLRARLLGPEEGDAARIADKRIEQARALAPGEALVIPCEPTLRLPPDHGVGGRAGWVALRALADLPRDIAFLCGATDGSDASTGSAGAIVTGETRDDCAPADIERALAAFDDAPLHAKLGTRIEGRATGLNFADVHVLARRRE